MNSKFTIPSAVVLGTVLLGIAQPGAAQAGSAPGGQPTKVGIINIQGALVSTRDGKKALGELQTKFAPRKADLEKKQSDVAQLQSQLSRGGSMLSEDARQKLMRDIDQKTKALNRDTEDAQAEVDHEEQKIMGDLGGRMMAVIDKYAKDNGYAVILDVSSQQTPVLWGSDAINITKDIIELYDKNPPTTPAAAPAPVTGAPATPSAITSPATPPPAIRAPRKP